MDADGLDFFVIQGFILHKDEVLNYMTQNASEFSDYSLKPLGNHKWLFYLYSLAACVSQAASL